MFYKKIMLSCVTSTIVNTLEEACRIGDKTRKEDDAKRQKQCPLLMDSLLRITSPNWSTSSSKSRHLLELECELESNVEIRCNSVTKPDISVTRKNW